MIPFCVTPPKEVKASTGGVIEQGTFKNVNNCLNNNIYSYLETSSGQSSNLYLNVVHFLNTVAAEDSCFPALVSILLLWVRPTFSPNFPIANEPTMGKFLGKTASSSGTHLNALYLPRQPWVTRH